MADPLKKDNNSVSVSGGVSDLDGTTILPLIVNHTTGRLKCSATLPAAQLTIGSTVINGGTIGFVLYDNNGVLGEKTGGGTGTVTSTSVVTANGFEGTVANATTTPAISINVDATHYLPTTIDQSNWNGKGAGTVTSASVVSANGFAGTVANATTTPTITISTSITGLLKGNATAISAATADVDYTTPSGTETLINKRVTPRVGTQSNSSSTPTINTDNYDFFSITGQNIAITSMTSGLSGIPTQGQKFIAQITGTTTTAITWGTGYEASTVALPTQMTTSLLTIGFLYNSTTSKWTCVANA